MKNNLGVYLEGGGNKVFFSLGFLQEIRKQGVRPSLFVGVSASSAIMFEEIVGYEGESLKIFYCFKKEHFPHNRIYSDSVAEFLAHVPDIPKKKKWKIVVSLSSAKFCRLKSFLSSLVIAFPFKWLKKSFRRLMGVEVLSFGPRDFRNLKDLANVIVGSSTIYPFIKPHFFNGKLLMEGGLASPDYEHFFKDCERSLVINPSKGETKKIGNSLFVFSSEDVPLNVLDYTHEKKIFELYNLGRKEARKQMSVIKDYLKA
jgi:hypothetical protein